MILWSVDIGRHMAVLYATQMVLEEGRVGNNETASGGGGGGSGGCSDTYGQEEETIVAGMSVVGRAFHVTLKQAMNASFTCSVLFGATTVLNSLRGSIGSTFPNLRKRTIVNTK